MEDRDAQELRVSLQSLQKDVESKAATIKHLQNALDAKSMTIGILSKANREGGDIEAHITNAVKAKIQAAVKAKDEEIAKLREAAATSDGRPSAAKEVAATAWAEREQRSRLEAKLAAQREELIKVGVAREEVARREEALQRSLDEERRLREAAEGEYQRLQRALEAAGAERAAALEDARAEREEALTGARELARRQAECERQAQELELEELRQRLQELEELRPRLQEQEDLTRGLRAKQEEQEELVRKLQAEKEELEKQVPSEQERGRLAAVRGSFEALGRVEMRAASAEVRALQAEDVAKKAQAATEEAEKRLEEQQRLAADAKRDAQAAEEQLQAQRRIAQEASEAGDALRRKLEEEQRSARAARQQLEQEQAAAKEAQESARVSQQRLEEEKRQSSEVQREMRTYQTSAFELKSANDVLTSQLDNAHEEMQAMQVEHQQELEELQRELRTLQGDRETQWRAVTEQIDTRVKEMRQLAEREKDGLLEEQAAERERERRRLRELTEESDRLRLRCDAQELELRALREAAGDDGEASPSKAAAGAAAAALASEPAAEGAAAAGEAAAPPSRRERARALREQSQFAFDEMTKRITEVREEAEDERKRLRADLDQKLQERGAQIVEQTNRADSLQTQVETLERERDSLTQQRDELSRTLRDKERAANAAQDEIEGLNEAHRLAQQQLAVFRLSHTLQRSALAPAFSSFRQSVLAHTPLDVPNGPSPGNYIDDDKVDASTADGDGLDEVVEDDDEDDEDEEETYGVDQNGQDEWAEMLQANTLNALFTGADAVVESARVAAGDLTEHVQNIVQSLDLFPQMYSEQLQELDRSGKGKELRDFVCKHLARAMLRCQRIVSAITELCSRNDEVIGNLQNLVRVKGLEWHLTSLRAAGQHQVLLKLQSNQMTKLQTDYEDVLDQYGEQCAQNSQLERKSEELQKQIEDLKKALAAAESAQGSAKQPEDSIASTGKPSTSGSIVKAPPKSMEDIHQLMKQIETDTVAEAGAKAVAPAGKGKGPPGKGKAKGSPPLGASQPAPPADSQVPTDSQAPADSQTSETPAAEVSKGKGKHPGKGKSKGPAPPGAKAAAAPEPEAPTPAPEAAQTSPAEAPQAPSAPTGKGKGPPGKGKGPPPPGKGKGPPLPAAAGQETEASAPAPATDAPPGKGKGPGAPPGKGPGPPGGKGPAAPGGKGPGAPSGKGGPGGPAKGKGKGKDKGAQPKVDPGPEPPADLQPKNFHWTALTANRFQESIFAKLAEETPPEDASSQAASKPDAKSRRMKLDMSALTSAFFAKKKQEPSPEELAKAASSKKKAFATCLDGKKSQAVEIFLNGCGVKLDHVRGCVLDLDEKAIANEHLVAVLGFYPNSEELPTLKSFQDENDPSVLPWGRAEEFLIALMRIPDFKLRAECCIARGQFAEDFGSISQDVSTLRGCLSSIISSTALPSIFSVVVQIGNYLNYGTKRGAQFGFTLDTLPMLVRVEGAGDKTYTLIRFLMDTLEMDRTVRDEALEDLKLCDASSRLDFDDAVRRLGELERAVSKVADVVGASDPEGNAKGKVDDEKFGGAMRAFVADAQTKLSALRVQVDEVTESCKKCINLFAEKPKTPIGETLKKFADFRKDMEEARRTNLLARAKKEKAEKRRAEKENAAKAKAEKAAAATANGAPAPIQDCDSKASNAPVKGAMRKMKVKIPDKPLLSHSQPRRGDAETAGTGKAGFPRETSSGLAFSRDFQPPERERMTLGPASRPDFLKVSSSPGGRISIGVAHSSGDKGLGREELQKLLRGMDWAREAPC